MLEAIFSHSNYLATQKMMDATILRHSAIASNLANLETPNYKRIDIAPSFRAELNKAIAEKSPSKIRNLRPVIEEDLTALASNRDGNSVQLDRELLEMNQNYLSYSLQTRMINGTFSKLKLAITGR